MVVTSVFASTTWFTTISLKGTKSRPTILLGGGTKRIFHKSIDTFCCTNEVCYTKY